MRLGSPAAGSNRFSRGASWQDRSASTNVAAAQDLMKELGLELGQLKGVSPIRRSLLVWLVVPTRRDIFIRALIGLSQGLARFSGLFAIGS